jgi:cytochrome c oxidase cbb3-type subunit 3
MNGSSWRALTWVGATALSLATLAACHRSQAGSTTTAPARPGVSSDTIAALPLGDVAGAVQNTVAPTVSSPYESNPQAVAQGHELFVLMNCAGCHGYDAKGGMGPNLTDTYWRYGGTPASIFKSIYEGRPQGMPAWNPALPSDDIWKLVAYIQSLGGTFPASAYQAALQGDRAGDNVAPEVRNTVPANAEGMPHAASSSTATTSPAEARPDAGGKP